MTIEKSGYVAIIGRPNVGKSTLLNALVGKKISITSRKPQTTRHQILGIKTIDPVQAIYIDTPGFHKTEKNAMNRYMNRLAHSVIADADVIIFMIDAVHWYEEDEWILNQLKQDSANQLKQDSSKQLKHESANQLIQDSAKQLKQASAPVILVINKMDLIKNKAVLLPFIEKLQSQFNFADIVPLSARKPNNVHDLEEIILNRLPAGPHLFPANQVTDKSERFQAAELIREKLILATGQEVPYSTTVVIEAFKQEKKLLRISALIWVEREGQKPIVIGKNGERLKKIGMAARKDLEKLFNKKVFLQLWVKIKEDWTNNDTFLSRLGFESC
jgi:GTPase